MRYDQLRDEVATRKPGWEYLQEVMFLIARLPTYVPLVSNTQNLKTRKLKYELTLNGYYMQALILLDPERAREDPVVVKNIPYYKAKSALEAEVMKINPPPRPRNWGVVTSLC